ncbi:MAG: hypothetical protein V7K89_25570 [Nostoc sp.]|uniref:hypothetical protein n=1 Tax=Nostoc sp. TaxID=1180 RepID=UPI002FF6443C
MEDAFCASKFPLAIQLSCHWCDGVSLLLKAISTTGYAYAKESGNNTDGLVKSGVATFADY